MNIRNRRIYLVERFRFNLRDGKHDVHIYRCSLLKYHFSVLFHCVCNMFSVHHIYCRLIGSYVR